MANGAANFLSLSMLLKYILIAFLYLSLLCLSGCSNYMPSTTCKEIAAEADLIVNKHYYEKWATKPNKTDTLQLEVALAKLDGIYSKCPEIEPSIAYKKVRLFLLLGDYERGYNFVDSLDASKSFFQRDYEKSMYYLTFKARHFEKRGDLQSRDHQAKSATVLIENFLANNPYNRDAIADLLFTMALYADEATVIERLDKMPLQGNIGDVDFKEALKNSIVSNYQVMQKR
ncbi:hypothetical protein BH09BAC1_BH09BAC1_01310 [soil metagenome]